VSPAAAWTRLPTRHLWPEDLPVPVSELAESAGITGRAVIGSLPKATHYERMMHPPQVKGNAVTDQPQQGPQWGPPPGAPSKPKPAWWKARWVPIAGAAILGIIVGNAAGGSGQSSTSASAPAQTVTVTAPAPPAVTSVKPATADEQAAIDAKNKQADVRSAALDQRESAVAAREKAVGTQEATVTAGTIPGDGTFLVGKDIKPGTYRTTGGTDGGDCYWKRSRDASGTDTIANYINKGPTVVNILSSDVAFISQGCAAWTLVR